MNWERAKTLMIILLFVVNLVLGGILLSREWQGRELERRAMEDLSLVLEQNGLTVKPEQIPRGLSQTFDVEMDKDGNAPQAGQPTVRGLPVWGQVAGSWLWQDALPIDGTPCFSAGHALLQLTEDWPGTEKTGVLESGELGFTASPVAPDVLRLRPNWRFVISGEEYFVPACKAGA